MSPLKFSKHSIDAIHLHANDVAASIQSVATHITVYTDCIKLHHYNSSKSRVESILKFILHCELHVSKLLLALPLSLLSHDESSPDGLSTSLNNQNLLRSTHIHLFNILVRIDNLLHLTETYQHDEHYTIRDQIKHYRNSLDPTITALKVFNDLPLSQQHTLLYHIVHESIELRDDCNKTLDIMPSITNHKCFSVDEYNQLLIDRAPTYRINYDNQTECNLNTTSTLIQEQQILKHFLSAIKESS